MNEFRLKSKVYAAIFQNEQLIARIKNMDSYDDIKINITYDDCNYIVEIEKLWQTPEPGRFHISIIDNVSSATITHCMSFDIIFETDEWPTTYRKYLDIKKLMAI